MVSLTKNKDSDCTNILEDIVCASTAGVCCMYYGVLAEPTGTAAQIVNGDLYQAIFTNIGLPSTVGEASAYCTTNYPSDIAVLMAVDGTTYANGVITMSPANGSFSFNYYCSGAVTTLAATTAAVAVATISLY